MTLHSCPVHMYTQYTTEQSLMLYVLFMEHSGLGLKECGTSILES